ncbi:MAG: translocation/assembly module TamB domain-containing protein [Deltaproteobacteria bacterium]|nr:translocation/assembly module TamB domain-containing protein [Deltaproteobacteria bacterium]
MIRFQGNKIVFDRLRARVDNGSGELTGDLTHRNLKIEHVNLSLIANSFTYRSADGWLRSEFDGRLKLVGTLPSPLLSGTIAILDGRYTKDFTLLETLAEKPRPTAEEEAALILFNPRLDIIITTSGDFFIRNNIGEIGLRLNTTLGGTQRRPQFGGTVNVTEGTISYLGLNFEITKGFLEFRRQYATTIMEVTAERDIGIYHVTLVLRGPTDNLTLDLAATSPQGPLEKRDVISLIAFGTTERDRDEAKAAQQRGELTAQIIASQFTHVVERPVSRFTHLDTFRLEAADPRSQAISRVTMGKQLSDRLSLDFSTSINAESAEQTVTSEYFLTDHFLLKGIRGSHQRYDIRGALRFRSR